MRHTPWTPEQAAKGLSAFGHRVAERDGVWWTANAGRFWRPVDALAPLPVGTRPPRELRLGWHHVVDDRALWPHGADGADRPSAPAAGVDGLVPHKVLLDVGSYGLDRATKKLAADVRGSLRNNEFVVLDDARELLPVAAHLWAQARSRTGQWSPRDEARLARALAVRAELGTQIVVTGGRNGQVAGFWLAHLIGDRAYAEHVVIGDAGRTWEVGAGMYWTAVQAARAAGARVMDMGFWEPEMASIASFKRRFGAVVVPLPSRSRFAPGVGAALRRRRPVSYARLAGWRGDYPARWLRDDAGVPAEFRTGPAEGAQGRGDR